jgi:hypothetical protein
MPTADLWEIGASTFLVDHQPEAIPVKYPKGECGAISSMDACVNKEGCRWFRVFRDNGMCKEDPLHRCLTGAGGTPQDCECEAHHFHGDPQHADDLELFIPLSVTWNNMARKTVDRWVASLRECF